MPVSLSSALSNSLRPLRRFLASDTLTTFFPLTCVTITHTASAEKTFSCLVPLISPAVECAVMCLEPRTLLRWTQRSFALHIGDLESTKLVLAMRHGTGRISTYNAPTNSFRNQSNMTETMRSRSVLSAPIKTISWMP